MCHMHTVHAHNSTALIFCCLVNIDVPEENVPERVHCQNYVKNKVEPLILHILYIGIPVS